MKSVTTVIVPFYFRDKIENKHIKNSDEKLIFSKQVEPTPITLLRHWSTRSYARLSTQYELPTQEVIDFINHHSQLAEWRQKALRLAHLTRYEKSPLDADSMFSALDRELSTIVQGLTGASRELVQGVYAYKKYLRCAESLEWRSLWPQLEDMGFDFSKNGVTVESAQKIISKTKDIIKKEKIVIRDIDGARHELVGLNARTIIQKGLSSSMKHMWSLDEDDSFDEVDETSKKTKTKTKDEIEKERDDGVNLISGRSLILSLPLEIIESSLGTTRFEVNTIRRGHKKDDTYGYVTLKRVLIVLMPNQNGYCCFTFDIKPKAHISAEALAELQNQIYQLVRLGGEFNLSAYQPDEKIIHHPLYQERAARFLPRSLREAHFTLKDLTLWLIALNDAEAKLPAQSLALERCGHRRKYVHHTSIHLTTQELPEGEEWLDVLRQEVWRASRAVGMKRNAPSIAHRGDDISVHGERVAYSNLILGNAREGSCSLSWDELISTPQHKAFDVSHWSDSDYHGIYLLFYLHILGEEAMLEDLSYQALEIIKRNISISTDIGHKNYLDRLKIRDELKRLIYEMVYLNLSFSSASIGGSSDYMYYLLTLKSVYSIDALRGELRDNISELSGIVEQIDQEQKQGFNNRLTVFGAIVLPFGLLSGLMGMNNFTISDEQLEMITPEYLSHVGFTTILCACASISLISFVFLMREKVSARWKRFKDFDFFNRKHKGHLALPQRWVRRP
jgi:hypothetical protein